MHIDSTERIASIPILKVRNYLRHRRFSLESLCGGLRLDQAAGKGVLVELLERGWATADEELPGDFKKTQPGLAFAAGSAARPLTRERAEALLEGAISRAKQINRDPQYAYYVKTIRLFGSMLSNKERPSDVDVAVELGERYDEDAASERVKDERREYAPHSADFIERLYWPQTEVYRIIRQRSTGLSVNEWRDLEKLVGEDNSKVVFKAGVVRRVRKQGGR
jgi:predicted nucleotidyltransferase